MTSARNRAPQAWEYAHAVGNLLVSFDHAGNVISCSGEPAIPIDNTFTAKDSGGNTVSLNSSQTATLTAHINQNLRHLHFVEPDVAAAA